MVCEPVWTDMTVTLDGNEAGNFMPYTNASQGKRRKIERPDKQDASEASSRISKEERRLAKKAKRATDRSQRSNDEVEAAGKSRYIFSLPSLGTMLRDVQTDLQQPMPRKLP